MKNMDIREEIEKKRLRHWEVAKEVGISPERFCVWLRQELPSEKKEMIFEAINKLSNSFS